MKRFFYIVIIALIIAGIIYVYPRIEWHEPTVNIGLESENVGTKPFVIDVRDEGRGLKQVSVTLVNEHGRFPLAEKTYPPGVNEDSIEVEINPKKLGIKGGPAEIRVRAEDRSRLRVFQGNQTSVDKKINLDLTPPKVEVLSTEHYINHGGSGVVIYETTPDAVKSGVTVGDYFFPGQSGYFENPEVHVAFFAFPYDASSEANVSVVAEDGAGNSKSAGFFYKLKNIIYRKSDIQVSNRFIQSVMAPLSDLDSSQEENLKKIFLEVNREMRKKNNAKIAEIGRNSRDEILWSGAFHQLTNSQVEANFADERTYFLNGEPVDKQYHLGYDLAVTRHYPVEAANSGIVAYADDLGIYGNTVIIDHGMGLTTLYGHLSSIDVEVGDKIEKKQPIGKTGETGLAAGDHLHFGVYVHGVAVRPVEWWDNKWINDNILNKLEQAEKDFGVKGKESAKK